MGKFGELGIDVRTRTTVQRIEKIVGGFIVHASTDGQEQEVAADLVVHAAGREPDLAALDLAAGGVVTENGRVKLNEFLQSVSNPKVYAAGDAAGNGPPLTPVVHNSANCGGWPQPLRSGLEVGGSARGISDEGLPRAGV